MIFQIRIQLFKIFFGDMGFGGGGGDGARVSIFLLTKNPVFYGRGWGTVSDFFFKKRGKGVRDATVNDFFYKESKSKKIKKIIFFLLGGGGGRWWVRGL